MTKAIVLCSGGLDSTTCLAKAVDMYGCDNVVGLSLFYGQRHDKELQCATNICNYYEVEHIVEDISNVMKYATSVCSLMEDSDMEIDDSSYEEQINKSVNGRVSTYVPFRNGLLLSIATSMADSLFWGDDIEIFYGAHSDDAAGNAYADCSPEFIKAMSEAINIGTYGKISINAPFMSLNKSDIVKIGIDLKVPYELTWSCYHGGEYACGKCGTCLDRIKAFENNGIKDPIKYE